MLNILLPFVVLSIASLLFSEKYKFNLIKSYLINNNNLKMENIKFYKFLQIIKFQSIE